MGAATHVRMADRADNADGEQSRSLVQITIAAAKGFGSDQCGLRAAALSYYTVFALPPLLILLIKLAGLIWDPHAVQQSIQGQFSGLVGSGGATTVSQMVSSGQHASHSVFTAVAAIVGLVLGATGAFLSLQTALNAVWQVGPDPEKGGILPFITKRLLSLGMVLALAFLLVVSLALTAAIGALSGVIGSAGVIVQIANVVISLAVLTVLFAAMFKYLPDAAIGWRSVWIGGFATAVLFEVGKFVIGLYLGHSNPGNAFGAASALAVILVWIYYAGVLLLLGAEFTQHFAQARGHGVHPKAGAVCIVREERIVRAQGGESSNHNGGQRSMQMDNQDVRSISTHRGSDGRAAGRTELDGASIGDLFKRLSNDSSQLVQQEIHLAKVELRESAATAAGATGKIATAGVLALPGILSLTAAAIIGLQFLVRSYWLSSLIIGVVILAIAGFLVKRAISAFKEGLAPKETIRTVRDDADWAKDETQRVKRELSA
ncbi:MAG TPA: YhjD/YihY/BrkB family envelope integrity protein [Gemmatimonadaceae bacterium]